MLPSAINEAIGGCVMRRLCALTVFLLLLAGLAACKNPTLQGGGGSNGGGGGTIHTGIPF
jgi:hypothetical protein